MLAKSLAAEATREIERLLGADATQTLGDFEAAETAVRTAVLAVAARFVAERLNADHSDQHAAGRPCRCGHTARYAGRRAKRDPCKHAVGARLKRAGMHWSVNGANAILALRCCILSGRFESEVHPRSRAAPNPPVAAVVRNAAPNVRHAPLLPQLEHVQSVTGVRMHDIRAQQRRHAPRAAPAETGRHGEVLRAVDAGTRRARSIRRCTGKPCTDVPSRVSQSTSPVAASWARK